MSLLRAGDEQLLGVCTPKARQEAEGRESFSERERLFVTGLCSPPRKSLNLVAVIAEDRSFSAFTFRHGFARRWPTRARIVEGRRESAIWVKGIVAVWD